MMPPDPIVVALSRAKIMLILLGSTAFVALALLLWPALSLIPRRGPLYATVLGIVVAFFAVCGLYALRKLFDTAPGLVIDAEGIVDNSSGVSAGRIPWSEVRGFQVMTVQRQRFVTIEVEEPQKYVQRAPFLKRQLVGLNAKYFGGPIQIAASTLKIDFDELLALLERSFEYYRRG